MSRISLLLHKSEAKPRTSVTVITMISYSSCLCPKGLSQTELLLQNKKQWLLVTITCKDEKRVDSQHVIRKL